MTRFPLGPPADGDGLRRALADARRRRFRTLGTACVVPVLAGFVALAAPDGSPGSRLQVGPVSPVIASEDPASPEPEPEPVPGSPSAEPGTASPEPSASEEPEPSESPEAEPSHPGYVDDPTLPDDPPAPSYDMDRAVYPEAGPHDCYLAESSLTDWCVDVVPGKAEVKVELCRARATAGQLTFATEREADFRVADSTGTTVWRWSAGRTFASEAHAVELPRFGCVVWWTRWDGVDDAGTPLARGRYTLSASVFASETAEVRDVEVEFDHT